MSTSHDEQPSRDTPQQPASEPVSAFEQEAGQERVGFVTELWDFLKHNKKWWLLPILIVLLLMSVLIILGYTGLAPFLYPA